MEIIQITPTESQKYNHFVGSHPLGTVQQTYEWGEFQSKSAKRDKFWALTLKKKGLILQHVDSSALIIRQKLPFGLCWLYCPCGPLTNYENFDKTHPLLDKINEIAKQEKAVFLRIDPPIPETHTENFCKSIGARPAHAEYQPESTLIIDLTLSEDEILKQMKPKGRYNIKVAKKHGVTVKIENNSKIFYDLFKQTTTRDQFSGHPQKYYQDMLETLGPEKCKLYIAEHKGKPLAAAIVTYFKDTATYFFGASSNEHRNTMAPYLLHWQIMLDAKAKGFKIYDFFGIAPEDKPGHSWAKVTQFKLKFGGKRINYLPAYEIVYKPFWYTVIRVIKWIIGILPKH